MVLSTEGMLMLGSERVVTSSPFTYSGSYRRIRNKVASVSNPAVKWVLAVPVAVLAVLAMWAVATVVWILSACLFFVSVPWKMMRRGSRKRRRDDLRHEELLEAARPREDAER